MQLLLEASADDSDEPEYETATSNKSKRVKKSLTDIEIVGLSMGFFVAGEVQYVSFIIKEVNTCKKICLEKWHGWFNW